MATTRTEASSTPTSSNPLSPREAAIQLLAAATSSLCSWLPTYGIYVTTTHRLSLKSSCYQEVLRKSSKNAVGERSRTLLLRLQVTICSTTCQRGYGLHLRVLVYEPLEAVLMQKMEKQIRSIISTGGDVLCLSLVQVSQKRSLPLEMK